MKPRSAMIFHAPARPASSVLSGDAAANVDYAEKAIPICREFGLTPDLSQALEFRGWGRFLLGLDDGLADNREAVRLSQEAGLPRATVALTNLAGLVWENGEPTSALEIYGEAVSLAERRGLLTTGRWAKAETTWLLYDLGRWDELQAVAEDVLSADPDRSQVSFVCLPYVAFTKAWRGELEEAARIVEEILPRSREIHDPQVLLPALEAAALVSWRLGDAARALEIVGEFEEETSGRPMWRAFYLPTLLRILFAEGRSADALRLLDGTEEFGARRVSCMASARAIAAEGTGDLAEAVRRYEDAAERWREFGHVLEDGQALLGAGRCLVELGSPAQATGHLREARERFVRLGATPLIEEVDDMLERATALSS